MFRDYSGTPNLLWTPLFPYSFPRLDMFGPLLSPVGGGEKFSTFSRRDCQFWPISAHRTADLHVNTRKIGHDRVCPVCTAPLPGVVLWRKFPSLSSPESGARSAPAIFLAWTHQLFWSGHTHLFRLTIFPDKVVRHVFLSDGRTSFSRWACIQPWLSNLACVDHGRPPYPFRTPSRTINQSGSGFGGSQLISTPNSTVQY